MRRSTIVVAALAATIATASGAPNSGNSSRGTSLHAKAQQVAAQSVARSSKADRSRNAGGAAAVPSQAGPRGAAAFTSARNAAAPVAAPAQASVQSASLRTSARQTVRAAQGRSARAELRRSASLKRAAARSRTVALTRDAPIAVERSAGRIAATAPTGAIPGMVTAAAQRAGVDPALGHAVVKVESMYQPRATGKGGYIGLMQLSYQTARGMGFRGSRQALYEPSANLQYGMRYLAEAVRKAGGNTCAAVSKYQGGHAVKGVTSAGAVYCAKVRRHMRADASGVGRNRG